MHVDVAIVGAGMSGLAAAIRLAHFGRNVVVLERHSRCGGLNSFYKKGGHVLDTGLHAVTNWIPPDYQGPRTPLARISRQLRIPIEDFQLDPQRTSRIAFLGGQVTLDFDNGLGLLTEQVRERFGDQVDGFTRLARACEAYPDGLTDVPHRSARGWVLEFIRDPLLVEMLLCPLLFYGSARQGDTDVEQFTILFNSIYREGLSRPPRGVRQFLDLLCNRLDQAGGRLMLHAGVRSLVVQGGRVSHLLLDDGSQVTADVVISSAGLVETMRMCSDLPANSYADSLGNLSFVETIHLLDVPISQLGCTSSVVFFNHTDRFRWTPPGQPVDFTSGVISCPENFSHAAPLPRHELRATHLACHRHWFSILHKSKQYQEAKTAAVAGSLHAIRPYVGLAAPHVTFTDAYTPQTVTRYTGRVNGAIYGSPDKRRSARTDLANLFLCGTDQGMLGIMGAMVSGIAVANAYGMG
jgi:phytoene dehydrogenase-like protein